MLPDWWREPVSYIKPPRNPPFKSCPEQATPLEPSIPSGDPLPIWNGFLRQRRTSLRRSFNGFPHRKRLPQTAKRPVKTGLFAQGGQQDLSIMRIIAKRQIYLNIFIEYYNCTCQTQPRFFESPSFFRASLCQRERYRQEKCFIPHDIFLIQFVLSHFFSPIFALPH